MTERILIADASAAARQELRVVLEQEGFELTEAQDADGALERLRAAGHHAAFVDVALPGGVGRVLDDLTTDPDLAGTVVVVMSDDLAGPAVADSLARGAADCLRKPVEAAEAIARAQAAARVAQLQRRLREGDERLTELAATDDLTGLLGRRVLESHLRGLVAAAARHGRALSVVMLDLDNFKDINDVHGHAAGDEVLRSAVDRMRSNLRREDLLGRWGGDEMILVLPDIELAAAVTAAEKLRRAIEQADVRLDETRIPITLSAGAAQWSDETAQALIDRADSALYAAKDAGRNRVVGDRLKRAA